MGPRAVDGRDRVVYGAGGEPLDRDPRAWEPSIAWAAQPVTRRPPVDSRSQGRTRRRRLREHDRAVPWFHLERLEEPAAWPGVHEGRTRPVRPRERGAGPLG